MEADKEMDKKELSKAFKTNGLGLTSLEKNESPIPAVTYTLKVSGTG